MLSVETFPSNPLGLNLGSEAVAVCLICLYSTSSSYSYNAFATLKKTLKRVSSARNIYFRNLSNGST